MKEKALENEKGKEKEKEKEKESTPVEDKNASQEPQTEENKILSENSTENKETNDDLGQINLESDDFKYSFGINLDAFGAYKLADSVEKIKQDKKLIIEASHYLLNAVIPSFVIFFFFF